MTQATSQNLRMIGSAQPASTSEIDSSIQLRSERAAAVWNSRGEAYDSISRQIATALERCMAQLDPKGCEEILNLATGTGSTSRSGDQDALAATACEPVIFGRIINAWRLPDRAQGAPEARLIVARRLG